MSSPLIDLIDSKPDPDPAEMAVRQFCDQLLALDTGIDAHGSRRDQTICSYGMRLAVLLEAIRKRRAV